MLDTKMEKEWKAWQEIVKLWPGDINDKKFNELVKAINAWGEELALLRIRDYKRLNKLK